jgi:hypothetical protein
MFTCNILSKCNFRTVAERCEFLLLKSAFKSIVKGSTVAINSIDRSFPKLTVLHCNSESLRRSIVLLIVQQHSVTTYQQDTVEY